MDYSKSKERSLGSNMDLKIREQAKKVRGAALRAEELVALQSLSILHSTRSEFERERNVESKADGIRERV